jgi:hypothetical protein
MAGIYMVTALGQKVITKQGKVANPILGQHKVKNIML